jgi:diguanylate cyclase (GGDEF)-like protein
MPALAHVKRMVCSEAAAVVRSLRLLGSRLRRRRLETARDGRDTRSSFSRRGVSRATERDPLTGLHTLRAVEAALEDALGSPRSSGREVGVLLVDVDGMKEINDRYGHDAGDRILAAVADRLRQAVSEDDLVARTGGDEFAVFALSASTAERLQALERRLGEAISSEPVSLGGHEVLIGGTVGATMMRSTADIVGALRVADQKMYLAKRRAGTDAFDRVSELIVGLLEAGDQGVDASIVSGVAEVALATRAYIDTGEHERWWPDDEPTDADSVRELAAKARELDQVVEGGQWRLSAPLRGDGEPIGAFVVERDFPFTKADQIALSRAGIALGQALLRLKETVAARRRISELEHLAFRDENTGLANRRALLGELERLDSHVGPLSLLFLDFDGLRAVNNQLSYEHGNELLRTVAAEIEQSLQPGEFAARLHGSGGDEFIVVCPGLDASSAASRAADLEHRLSPENVELSDQLTRLYGGASVGYAVRDAGEEALDLVERAAMLMRTRKAERKSSRASR